MLPQLQDKACASASKLAWGTFCGNGEEDGEETGLIRRGQEVGIGLGIRS